MKIGLFFGSYNPIHIGHLAIANYIVEYTDIDELWFVVTPHNPFKNKKNLLDDYQRLHLVNLAIENDHRFKACDIEFWLPKPSFTLNTLTHLSEKYKTNEFFPIIGGDNFANIHKWRNSDIMLRDYHFIVYPRPDTDINRIQQMGKFTIIDAPLIEVSSSFIRKSITNNKDIRHFLHPSVYQYIKEMRLYE